MSINWLTYAGFAAPPCLPCCDVLECCLFYATGSGDGGSVTGSLPTSTTAEMDVTTTNSSPTLALDLTGTLALIFSAGATVTLTFTTDGFTCSAVIEGLTPDSEGAGTRTYTIPTDGCYIITLTADTGPGSFTSLTASVDVTSDLDIGCATLEDQGFTPGGGGPGP